MADAALTFVKKRIPRRAETLRNFDEFIIPPIIRLIAIITGAVILPLIQVKNPGFLKKLFSRKHLC